MRFSIIIPAHARPENLKQCLRGVAALDYPRDRFEVIAVDDGSPVSLEPVVRPFAGTFSLTLLRQAQAGPGSARNFGAQHARGEWLAFLDDDCVPRSSWLKELESAAEKSPEAMLGGGTLNGCPDNIFAELNHILLTAVRKWFRDHGSVLNFLPSNNLCLPKAGFRALGGFHPECNLAGGEDRELCARWLTSGGPMVDVPGAVVDHYHPQTFSSFLSMHVRYGRGAAQLHRNRHSSPWHSGTIGVHAAVLRATFQAQPRSSRPTLAALFAVAQAVETLGYARETWFPTTKTILGPLGELAQKRK